MKRTFSPHFSYNWSTIIYFIIWKLTTYSTKTKTFKILFTLIVFSFLSISSVVSQSCSSSTAQFQADLDGCILTAEGTPATDIAQRLWFINGTLVQNSTGVDVNSSLTIELECMSSFTLTHQVVCSNGSTFTATEDFEELILPVIDITATLSTKTPVCGENVIVEYEFCSGLCNDQETELPENPLDLMLVLPEGVSIVEGDFNIDGTLTFSQKENCMIQEVVLSLDETVLNQPEIEFTLFVQGECITTNPPEHLGLTSILRPTTPELTITKTAPTEVINVGETAVFNISITNTSESVLHNIEIIDVFPTGLVPVNLPPNWIPMGMEVLIPVGAMASGEVRNFELEMMNNAMCGDELVNEAFAQIPNCSYETEIVSATISIGLGGANIINANDEDISDLGITGNDPVRMVVTGTLTIDDDFTFPANSTLLMLAGAEILVPTGVRLAFEPGCCLMGCEKLWQGIILESGSALVMEQTYISDARQAILVQNQVKELTLVGTTFNKNYIGIHAPGPDNGQHNSIDWIFKRNTFECTENLLPRFDNSAPRPVNNAKGIAGVLLRDGDLLRFDGENYFRDLSHGIFTTRTDLVVHGVFFKDIQPGGYIRGGYAIRSEGNSEKSNYLIVGSSNLGSGITSNEFENCHRSIHGSAVQTAIHQNHITKTNFGIHIRRSPNRIIAVINNHIESDFRGIELLNNFPASRILVDDNDIIIDGPDNEPRGFGILAADSDRASQECFVRRNTIMTHNLTTGISVNSSDQYVLELNTIRIENPLSVKDDESSTISATRGIDMESSHECNLYLNKVFGFGEGILEIAEVDAYRFVQSQDNLVCENASDNTAVGFHYLGICDAPNHFRNNGIGTHTTGLLYSEGAITDEQRTLNSNWDGSYGNFAAEHEDGVNTALLSVHFCPDDLASCPIGQGLVNPPEWFTGGGEQLNCGEEYQGRQLTRTERKRMEENIEYSHSPESYRSMMGFYVFDVIQTNPDIPLEDELALLFRETQNLLTLGQLWHWEQTLDVVETLSETEAEQIATLDSLLEETLLELAVVDSILANNPTSNIIGVKDDLANTYLYIKNGLDAIRHTYETERQNQLDDLEMQLNTIIPTNIVEENIQQFYQLYLALTDDSFSTFTEEQIEQLERIAEQCPLEGGHTVFSARNLLRLALGDDFFVRDICATIGERSDENSWATEGKKEYFDNIDVVPNPAQDQIQISFSNNYSAQSQYFIYNALGQLKSTQHISNNEITLDVSNWNNGTYFVVIHAPNAPPVSTKFIIIR